MPSLVAAAVRLEPAIAFVREKGGGDDHALLKVLLGEPLSDADLVALTDSQNPDGGFRVPQLNTKASVVGRTAEMLTYLVALGAGEFGTAQASADFLIENQQPDGTWGEPESLRAASPPPLFAPGSTEVIGWETAAAVVALTGIGIPLDFRSALEWLDRRVHPAGSRLFPLEALLAYACFVRHQGEGSDSARRLRGEVETYAEKGLEVFELDWAIFALHAVGAGSGDALVMTFGAALAAKQSAAGGFGSGPAPNPYETVLALCALEHAGLVEIERAPAPAAQEPDPARSDHTM